MTTNNPKYNRYILVIGILFFFTGLSTALAGDFHDPPRDFLFGNHIDTHQETKLKLDKNNQPESLSGFLYIIFTDDSPDPVSGLPIARHPRGANEGEACGVDVDCVKGWDIYGVPARGVAPGEDIAGAKFLYHSGVNGNDHAVWMVDRVDIPQPGSFTHFHWINQDSSDPRRESVPDPCNVESASQLEQIVPPAEVSAVNVVCPGWFLEIDARIPFAFKHGNETIPVWPEEDNSTHLNLVTNFPEDLGITPTR